MTVGISVNRSFKSGRDKLSGVLRYAATKPRWTIAILGEAGTKDVTLDALISLYGAPSGMLQGGGGRFR